MTKLQTLKGFRDFLPEKMKVRNYVLKTLQQVFESFAFEPLETPALEYSSVLLGKYGKEADKLVYTFKDRGKRDIGLRYDLTVPVSRVLAQYNQKIPLPFKRYQIQKVWRAEKPQKSRYREFIQCDVDIFGISSPLADGEIVGVIYQALKKLGFKKFIIQINSRQVLFQLLSKIGLREEKEQLSVLQSIDKLEKQGRKKVTQELKQKKLTTKQIKDLFDQLNKISPDKKLEKMFSYLQYLKIPQEYYQFTPSLARGLDYYNGPIFETIVPGSSTGSLTGGGRYDKLISLLGGPDIPATGTTIGFDRICDLIERKNLLPEISQTTARVLLAVFPDYLQKTIQTAQKLRENKINCDLYLDDKNISKQLDYANKKKIPFVILIGEEEIKNNKLTLKNMKSGQQKMIDFKKAVKIIKDYKQTAINV